MIEQRAVDTFSIEVEGPYHCGPDNTSPKSFDYEITIEYLNDALDERGFVLDNLAFREYFAGLKRTSLSCELLCCKCARDLMALTEGKALRVCVAIWAIKEHVCVKKVYSRAEYHAELAESKAAGVAST